MKKVSLLIIIIPFALSIFFVSAQSAETGKLFSFRGVLYGILNDVVGEAGEAVLEIPPSPFKNDTDAANNPDNSFAFAVIGDTQRFDAGNPNGNFQKAVANIKKSNPDLVFAVGDLVGSCDGDRKCSKEYSGWKQVAGSFFPETYA